jgi:DNA-binding transcriptional LysR family regulator
MIVFQMEQLNTSLGIDPNDLLIFARVAELGSFSRAAQWLKLPKSTVSRRLAGLEQHLGEKLMLRTTRRQTITEFGLQLLDHARQVAAEVAAVSDLRERRQATPSGRLRVSMPSDVANLLLADTLTAFMALHPAVVLELDLSPRRVDLLGEGFDLALRMGDLPDDTYLAARRLATFSIGLYASPNYLADHGDLSDPQDLSRHESIRMLSGNGEPSPWTLMQEEQRWQGIPVGRASANSPELLIRLVPAQPGRVGSVSRAETDAREDPRLHRHASDFSGTGAAIAEGTNNGQGHLTHTNRSEAVSCTQTAHAHAVIAVASKLHVTRFVLKRCRPIGCERIFNPHTV